MAVYEKIHKLESGDKITVSTWTESPDRIMTVQRWKHGEVIATDNNNKSYRLIDSYWGGKHGNVGNGQPWLRTLDTNESCGEIKEIKIVE